MSTKGSVMQSSASCSVRNIDVAEKWDQSLGTANRFVARCNVERRLPVLVTSVDVGAVLQKHCHCILFGERA